MARRAIHAALAKGGTLAISIVVAACSQSSSEPSSDVLVNCAPVGYLSGEACTPLSINEPADASGWMNDPGPDDASVDAGALGTDATVGDADAFDSGSLPSGPDLDALDVDVQCEDGIPVPACVEYFAAFTACTGVNMLFAACQDGLLEMPDADVASITALCEGNLQRLGCY